MFLVHLKLEHMYVESRNEIRKFRRIWRPTGLERVSGE